MRRVLKMGGFIVLISIGLFILYVAVTFPPVMAGMVAKTTCSCVFLSGRSVESIREKELQVFPGLSSAKIVVDNNDSTVSSSVLWKTRKAIFRPGLGCTLLAERSEAELRAQKFNLATPRENSDTLRWPAGDLNDSLRVQVDREIINKALDDAFSETDPERPQSTLAVLAVYDGQIIAERYATGIDRNTRLMGWSMTKSITNALIGILVKEGKLKTEQPAPVPEWKDDNRKDITLNNLLQASSGLSWWESYFIPTSHFHNMFMRSDDKGGYAAGLKLKYKPGEHYEYSSGTTNILSRMIRQIEGDTAYYRFPYEKLFYKIGMNQTVLEPDASGTFVGSSYTFATARDWARFGLLYLNDGVWNGERILPEGWVAYTTTPAPAADKGKYGAQWWLNQGEKGNPSARYFPDLPTEVYWADGFEEQFVMVVPSRKLVVVRLGVSHHGSDFSGLVNGIIGALREGEL